MKAIKLTRVNDIDLGTAPTGYLTKNGDIFTYDNKEVIIGLQEKATFYDEAGVAFEEETIAEILEYFEEYSE